MNELTQLIADKASLYPVAAREFNPTIHGYAVIEGEYSIIRKHDHLILFTESNPATSLEEAIAHWNYDCMMAGLGDDLVGCDGG